MTRSHRCLGLLVMLVAGALSVASAGQRPSTPPPGMALVDFGRQWNAWSDAQRALYLTGFADGSSDVFLKAWEIPDLTQSRRVELQAKTARNYDLNVIGRVMTDLYRDPANTLVRYAVILYIAQDKLDGKNIESQLLEAREKERAYYKP